MTTRISRSKALEHAEPAPLFVLVEPQMGENIGSAARAMLNFGVTGLRLVDPRDGWPNPKAAATASGAAAVIDGARVCKTTAEAVADCEYVVATTARQREVLLPVLSPGEAARSLRNRVAAGERCAVLFGGERNGLSANDIILADAIVTAPVNPAFASINLAQAVLLMAYEWRLSSDSPIEDSVTDEKPAPRSDVVRLMDYLEAELDDAGYFFPPEMRDIMSRNLRVAFTRARFTEGEVRSLWGVIKSLTRKSMS